MKYMIHTYPKRKWYVDNYLIPSLKNQKIKSSDIYIFIDENKRGNLQAFLDSLDWIYNNLSEEKGLWHLQDDVIVSKNFKKETEKASDKIINGFVCKSYNPSKLEKTGKQIMKNHWLSFPCIYIPNKYIYPFLSYMNEIENKDKYNRDKVKYDRGRGDDYFFYKFLRTKFSKDECINLNPNLVDHIDYLIGNSTLFGKRAFSTRSYYFNDLDLVKELERKTKNELSQIN